MNAFSHRSFTVGAVLSTLLALAAALSFAWTPHSPYEVDIAAQLQGASAAHWFGTDAYGRQFGRPARARGNGASSSTMEHALPNMASVLIVQPTIRFAIAILAEAPLSYLGLGTQPPQPSWGRMLAEAQTLMFQSPMLAVYPGVAIALAVLGLNLLGDGLRDIFDPKLTRQR